MSYIKKLLPHEFNNWQNKRPLLGQLDIELTERCNNACLHCCINLPEDDAASRDREMNTDFVKDVLSQAAGLGCLTVRFTGGEPLLREDFAELYEFARRMGMQVILFTNACLVTPELAVLLARIPPGRVLEVSVYGMRPESYDRAVGRKGAFEEFRRGVSLLEEHRIPFIVKAALLPLWKEELAEFESWARTILHMDKMPGYSMNFNLRSRRDNAAKNATIAGLRATPEETVSMLLRNPHFLEELKQFCRKFMGSSGDRLFSCGAGHGACIDAYGKVQMCLLLKNPATVVDLREVTLKTVLTEVFPAMRESSVATNPDYLRRCARCFLKGLCEQCPAKSWMENGTLDTPVEYLCAVAHAQGRHLGLLGDNENAWDVAGSGARHSG